MIDLTIKHVDAFTTKPFSGNPAGVITEGDGLAQELMLKIACEMNLSETVFVTVASTDEALYRLRFFTPGGEVDMSGHPTIAATYALVEEGRLPLADGVTKAVFETNIGCINVDVHFRKGGRLAAGEEGVELSLPEGAGGVLERIMLHQSVSDHRSASVPASEIARILGIDTGEITRTGLPLEIISSGLDELFVPIARKEIVLEMHPDLISLGLMNRKHGIHTNHVFSLDAFHEGCTSYARGFAPVLAMWEDPASGMAAAALYSYLVHHGIVTPGPIVMEQGNDVDNLARILAEPGPDGDPDHVQVGGLAVTSITRHARLDSDAVVIS